MSDPISKIRPGPIKTCLEWLRDELSDHKKKLDAHHKDLQEHKKYTRDGFKGLKEDHKEARLARSKIYDKIDSINKKVAYVLGVFALLLPLVIYLLSKGQP